MGALFLVFFMLDSNRKYKGYWGHNLNKFYGFNKAAG